MYIKKATDYFGGLFISLFVQIKRYLLSFRSLRGKQGPDLPER